MAFGLPAEPESMVKINHTINIIKILIWLILIIGSDNELSDPIIKPIKIIILNMLGSDPIIKLIIFLKWLC